MHYVSGWARAMGGTYYPAILPFDSMVVYGFL